MKKYCKETFTFLYITFRGFKKIVFISSLTDNDVSYCPGNFLNQFPNYKEKEGEKQNYDGPFKHSPFGE
jgi:hypothetical protein